MTYHRRCCLSKQYEKLVPDYNFGTILRGDAKREYDEDNSILVTRVQFYAIEVSFRSFLLGDKQGIDTGTDKNLTRICFWRM